MRRSFALVILAACTDVARTNPFDPAAPESVRSPARITGQVTFEAGTGAGDAQVLAFEAVESSDAGPRSFAATPDASGAFTVEVPSGIYNVFVKASRFTPSSFYGINIQPGQTYGLGSLTLLLARGSISGQVLLSDSVARAGAPAVSVPVSFSRVGDTSGLVFSATTGSDGRFRSDGVPEGRYVVRASKDGYAPGYLSEPIDINNTTAAVAAPITLYPASAIVRPVGGNFTVRRSVSLDLLAFVDGLRDMRISEDPMFAGRDYQSFAANVSYELGDSEGAHKIYVQFRDAAGLESPVFSTTVTLDRTPPTVTQLEIAGGKLAITEDSASIALGGYDELSGVRGYRLSTDGTLDTEPELSAMSLGSAITLVVEQPFVGGDGDRSVTLVWIDRAGNVSAPTQATITKDTSPPQLATFAIVGAPYATKEVVTLSVQATSATQMLLSNRSDFADASWEAYLSTRTWVLTPGDGPKLVYLRLRDGAGNTIDAVNAQVTLDGTPPVAVLGINSFYNGQGVTTSSTVTLNLDASDATSGVTKVQISNSQDFSAAPLDDWQPTRAGWSLGAADGLKFVYVRFIDAAGNPTTTSNFITKDTTGPQGTLTISEAPRTNQSTVQLNISAVDADTMQISGDVDTAQLPPTFQAYAPTVQAPLAVTGCADPGDCPRTINVVLRDVNLNAASATQATIVYDAVAPTFVSGGPTGGTINATQEITLVFSEQLRRTSVISFGGIASYHFGSIFASTNTTDDTLRFRPFIVWPQGTQTLSVSYGDRAGNTGQSLAFTFTVDAVGPVITLSPPTNTPIRRDRDIVVDFNEPVGTFGVTGSLVASGFSSTLSNGNQRLTLSPTGQWAASGPLSLQVNVTDAVGNPSQVSASYPIDTTRPTLAFAPSGGVIGGQTPIVVTFDEPVSQASLTLGGGMTSGTNITRLWLSPQSVRLTPDAWPSGAHSLVVNADDIAGNGTSGNPTALYLVDVNPPSGNVTAPAASVVDAATPIEITFSETMNPTSHVITQGGAPLGTASASWSGGDTLTLTGPWMEGKDRSFSVTARDLAGNLSSAVVVTLSILDGAVYVSGASGSTGNPGTFDAPLLTIPPAIARADSLYTTAEVRVAGGSYFVNSDASTHVILAAGISVYGGYSANYSVRDPLLHTTVVSNVAAGPGTASLPSRALSCSTADGAVVDGLTLQAAPTGTFTTAVACLSTGTPTLQNNFIQKGATNDAVLLRSAAPIVRNTIVGDIRVEAADVSIISNTIAGSILLGGPGAFVSNNTVTSTPIGVSIDAMGPASLVNNIIICAASSGATFGVLETLATTPALVANNDISCGSATYADFVTAPSGSVCPPPFNTTHMCAIDAAALNASSVATLVEGNVDVLPVFADAAGRLAPATSADVRYGGRVVAATGATIDRDGLARTLGGSGATNAGAAGWSMGAFESP